MKIEIELPKRKGFEYTGEYRKPNKDEWGYCYILDKVFKADSELDNYRPTHILREVETLEEKVKAKYSDYEVVMLKWGEWDIRQERLSWIMVDSAGIKSAHVLAQSMKGFYKYVYLLDVGLSAFTSPIMAWRKDETVQPVAVLFTRDK